MVRQWLGVHAGERIDRLILSNTAPYLGPAPQWDALISGFAEKSDMDGMADMFLGNWFPGDFIAAKPKTVEPFRQMIMATPPHGLAGCFAVVRDMDLRRTDTLINPRRRHRLPYAHAVIRKTIAISQNGRKWNALAG